MKAGVPVLSRRMYIVQVYKNAAFHLAGEAAYFRPEPKCRMDFSGPGESREILFSPCDMILGGKATFLASEKWLHNRHDKGPT